ncbi:hypothetical protein Tco_1012619, partial [Tanacetum coccineum]
ESWGDSGDESSNDDDSDDVSKDDDDDADSDDDGGNDADDSGSTDSNEEENPNLNLKDNEEEETQEEEYIYTPDYYVPTDEETYDENWEFDEDGYDELYKDVNVRQKDTEHDKEGKGNAEITDASWDDFSQEKSFEQVVDDAHVKLTGTQKTEGSMESSSVSSEFASKFLNLDNVPPADNEVASMMNVKVRQEESSTQAPSLLIVPSTPTPAPTNEPTTTLILPILPDFSSLFGSDQRVSTLEKEISQIKQVDQSGQILASIKSKISAMVDDHLSIKIGYASQTALQSYTTKFEKKAQAEKETYINLIKKLIKDIIKDETSSKKVNCIEELNDNKDKDEDPLAGSDQGLKKQKTSKDKSSKGSKAKESKTGSSKGTKSQPKNFNKSAQAEEPVFEAVDTEMPHNQGSNLGDTDDQPNVEATPMDEWFKKPKRPPTPDPD